MKRGADMVLTVTDHATDGGEVAQFGESGVAVFTETDGEATSAPPHALGNNSFLFKALIGTTARGISSGTFEGVLDTPPWLAGPTLHSERRSALAPEDFSHDASRLNGRWTYIRKSKRKEKTEVDS
ncbi:hypothetical protein EJB05_47936, partial [Eragrostis curvula]